MRCSPSQCLWAGTLFPDLIADVVDLATPQAFTIPQSAKNSGLGNPIALLYTHSHVLSYFQETLPTQVIN